MRGSEAGQRDTPGRRGDAAGRHGVASEPVETPCLSSATLGAGTLGAALSVPLALGGLTLDRRLFMAPMAGLTSGPLRRSMRRWGAGLVHTEMISACGIRYGNRRTLDYLECSPGEHPIGYQVFGADPDIMAAAAAACLEAGADVIDINMACPVRKVLRTGAGAALLDDAARATTIVRAVSRALAGAAPVTVKVRSGVRGGEVTILELAPRLVEAGAAAVTLHPRSAAQLYRGVADHEVTRRLAAVLPVPVIASGDIGDAAACRTVLEAGAAGVMLARAALGRPWLFTEILRDVPPPGLHTRLQELSRFVEEVHRERGERGVGYLRQLWARFRRSGTLSRAQSTTLMGAATMSEVRALLAAARHAC